MTRKDNPGAHPTRHPGAEDIKDNVGRENDSRYPLRVRRGAAVEIRLSLREYQGHEHVDIRLWFGSDDGEWMPSRRGVTIPPHLWPRFFEAVVDLDHKLRSAGVVDNGLFVGLADLVIIGEEDGTCRLLEHN